MSKFENRSWKAETPGRVPAADLRREVREGLQVVAHQRGGAGELAAGQLHAVTGVAGEADDHFVEVLDRCLATRPDR
jgi:hypothetical protein